jgi:hypothetical protein
MYVWRHIEASSCNHCYSGKVTSITHSVRVFVASGIQHAMRVRHIVICGLPCSTIFFHIALQTARNSKTKTLLNIKQVFWFSLKLLSGTLIVLKRTERDMAKNVYWSPRKVPLLLSDFNENLISRHIFGKYSNIKFQENPDCGSEVVPCGHTDGQIWWN